MLDNWKLKDRTLLGFSIPTILIFIFSLVVYTTTNQVGKTFRQVGISHEAIIGTDDMALGIANMDRAIRRYLFDPKKHQDSLQNYITYKKNFQDGLNRSSSVVEDALQKQRLQAMQKKIEELDEFVKSLTTTNNIENNQYLIDKYMSYSIEINDRFTQINDEFNNREKEIMDTSIDGTKAMLNFMSLLAVLVTFLTIAIAAFVTSIIFKSLGSRISTVVTVADKISAGDLTSSLAENELNSKDEIGQLLESFKTMIQKLSTLIRQVQDLNPHFESVNKGMETQSMGAQQISEAMVQLSSTSVQTADSLREINNAISQLNQVSRGLRQEVSIFKVSNTLVETTAS